MKKLLFVLLLSLMITSCKAQKVEPEKNQVLDLKVLYINDGMAELHNKMYAKTFKADVSNLELVQDWEYTFLIRVVDCQKCTVKTAEILGYGISPLQADRNVKAMLKQHGIMYRKY